MHTQLKSPGLQAAIHAYTKLRIGCIQAIRALKGPHDDQLVRARLSMSLEAAAVVMGDYAREALSQAIDKIIKSLDDPDEIRDLVEAMPLEDVAIYARDHGLADSDIKNWTMEMFIERERELRAAVVEDMCR